MKMMSKILLNWGKTASDVSACYMPLQTAMMFDPSDYLAIDCSGESWPHQPSSHLDALQSTCHMPHLRHVK